MQTPDRVILIVLDSVGAGELPDAGVYGDEGSDTLGNIARAVPLRVPSLRRLGLSRVSTVPAEPGEPAPIGAFGRMAESSPGKDSVTGHWELMGLVLERPFPVFSEGFPRQLMERFEAAIGRGTLANRAASGTAIVDELGAEHMATGKPIVYTSADSVFQIAAHEAIVPIDELYRWCEIAFDLAGRGHGVGRVIARPFVGAPGAFSRTANRRDFALTPFTPTLLDRLKDAGLPVVTVGKVDDLFAGRGITSAVHTASDDDGVDQVLSAMRESSGGLIFANLVEFDTRFGHRNDVAGYAANLERFDRRVPELLSALGPRDLLVITADHGNDPTTPSTDHSREYVPVFVVGQPVRAGMDIGTRQTFADLGQTLAEVFGVGRLASGTSFLGQILVRGR
ncbi:MAG: phosphopentomutase [Acidobacteria bacterium]|nr:phosphopentomutase [Acidobacteriota bacterium]MBA3887281.1 phosphopentomutase [Acidobacteriota bacterium]